jgi:alpha-ketoglutarate-dependent taurine dioxygenase
MTDLVEQPVQNYERICWRGADIDPAKLRIELSSVEIAALTGGNDRALGDLRKRIMDQLENGTGMCILGGLAGHCDTEQSYDDASMTLGRAIGTCIAQNKAGEEIVHVKDVGASTSDPTQRGHKTKDALGFHNDRCDIILLTCIHQAEVGGDSYVVSAKYAHDLIKAQAPQHLETLYVDFPNHRRGEERSGEARWCPIPVFAWEQGKFVCRFVKRFITDSQILEEAPRMTQAQTKALDYMDDLINTPGVHLKFKLRPGDLFLVNNHVVLHGRSEYVDSGPHKRTLARVWLSHPESRALPAAFAPLYRDVRGGAVRGGL